VLNPLRKTLKQWRYFNHEYILVFDGNGERVFDSFSTIFFKKDNVIC